MTNHISSKRKQQIRAQWKRNSKRYEQQLAVQKKLAQRKKKVIKALTAIASIVAVICMVILSLGHMLLTGAVIIFILMIVCLVAYNDNRAPSAKGKENQFVPRNINHQNHLK